MPEGKVGKDMGNTSRRPDLRGGDGGDIWQVEVLEVLEVEVVFVWLLGLLA